MEQDPGDRLPKGGHVTRLCPDKGSSRPGRVTLLVGARPVHQKFAGSIPSQGTYLGRGFHPQLGHIWEATEGCFFLRPPAPHFPPSVSSINISLGED